MNVNELAPILECLPVAVFIIDRDRKTVLANSAAEGLFGDNLVGLDFVQAVRHPDCLRVINKVLGGRKNAGTVLSLNTPVRTTFQVHVAGLDPEPGSDEFDARAVISFENISHIREAEQMRSDFVANVSHELRSPLTALNGFIETLKGAARDDPEARERFLAIMEREAHRMSRLIEDLLSLSQVEANEHVRPGTKIDILSVIEQITTILAPQASLEQVELHLNKPDAPIQVLGDKDQLSQVFLNLIENAIKYGQSDSGVTISVRKVDRAAGVRGAAVAIEIVDRGVGIAPEHIARLTERFYRVDSSRSREKGGTGLGLAIVKHILSRHRGRLQIKSEVGSGSSFTVILPAHND